jgi:hypothetical protein
VSDELGMIFGLKCFTDEKLPPGIVELRDPISGRVLATAKVKTESLQSGTVTIQRFPMYRP